MVTVLFKKGFICFTAICFFMVGGISFAGDCSGKDSSDDDFCSHVMSQSECDEAPVCKWDK